MTIKMTMIIMLIVLLILTTISYLLQIEQFSAKPLLLQKEKIFTLSSGANQYSLKIFLKKEHLVSSHIDQLSQLVTLEPKLALIKAGTYRLTPGMTIRDLLLLLVSGKEAQFPIRLAEGSTLKECLNSLAQAPYLKHSQQECIKLKNLLEGNFYPDTYLYTSSTFDSEILDRAQLRMETFLKKIWHERDKHLPYTSPNSLLIMASLIEKETSIKKEKARIASVFINRLRIGMKLQSDPSVIYGINKDYHRGITRKDLAVPTPYNTYFINGLPPTPIAIPSQSSIEAAAHPEKSNYFYFVSDRNGGHIFSTNLINHNQAVQKYRKQRKI
ncbi:endolytic transglycosylase MltG [Sodalis sp. CWE]|uniref:endolytic transglycosylase MltG n=1 Tax=Sodalis sp. CWE TaxID=2803816 RepID=UPI001C7CB30B|nr:endolytic transglycosylase MltG [Sodalis sp. CWE]MBX4181047.1 endolytic transglycosylase MltG [Sodalis sp. CWE]